MKMCRKHPQGCWKNFGQSNKLSLSCVLCIIHITPIYQKHTAVCTASSWRPMLQPPPKKTKQTLFKKPGLQAENLWTPIRLEFQLDAWCATLHWENKATLATTEQYALMAGDTWNWICSRQLINFSPAQTRSQILEPRSISFYFISWGSAITQLTSQTPSTGWFIMCNSF